MDMSWFNASCLKINFLLFDIQILKNYKFKVRTIVDTQTKQNQLPPQLSHTNGQRKELTNLQNKPKQQHEEMWNMSYYIITIDIDVVSDTL